MGSRVVLGGVCLTLGSALVIYAAQPVRATARRKPHPGARAASRPSARGPVSFAGGVAPLIKKYCVACHGAAQASGDVALHSFKTEASVLKGRDVWEKAARNLHARRMPPRNMPQPTNAERALLVTWIESTLSAADCRLRDPGRVTMRRLNRAEYNNTIRDLIGIEFRPADDFPSDDVGYGFDNIGDVLSLPPLLMEKYLASSEKIAELAIVTTDQRGPVRRFEAERIPETGGAGVVKNLDRLLHSAGEVTLDFPFPADGTYLLRARAYGQQAGTEPARMTFRLDGKDLATVDVAAVEDSPALFEAKATVTKGKHRFALAFVNDYYNPRDPDEKNRDRNLAVDYLEIQGPETTANAVPPEAHRRIVTVRPKADTRQAREEAARKVLGDFARRAYRRPVMAAEVERLVRCVTLAEKEGESFEKGIQLAVQAVLVSPHFLFRVEQSPSPNNPKAVGAVGDWELASRLSYFLWSSMPDEELFRLAEKRQLRNPAVLEAQARRMLKDRKARAFTENFAGQWLQLRNLVTVSPDRKRFPAFDDSLRQAMQQESELFFQEVVQADRSVLDLLDARFTYLNQRLAEHYGIPGVQGDQFRRVVLSDDRRGGILTQASVLTVTSNPTRTSPVKRGKWIMEQILGTPPPPPPPDVPELKEGPEGENGMLTGTLRQRMEQHRKDPNCATCHDKMDTLGFAFENYDAIGRWRETEGQAAIDPSGTLPDGTSFQGPAKLKTLLRTQSKEFARSLAEKMLTYALGRGLEFYDRCAVNKLVDTAAKDRYRFSALLGGIVKSDPFRLRRGEGKTE